MALEIERKFLVKGDFKKDAGKGIHIIQGYLSSVPDRIVRIRIRGNQGFMTIKGIVNQSGTSRFEWEKEIPLSEADELLKICEPGIINKIRYLVKSGKHIFEVDVFYAENLGLIIAEIELTDENEIFVKPEWLGEEVTGDSRYYNSMLIKNPFTRW